jgi:hypothetical protein
MKTTRQKRPDRVICKWKDYYVELSENNNVYISTRGCLNYFNIPLSEIPNLIKALQEVGK